MEIIDNSAIKVIVPVSVAEHVLSTIDRSHDVGDGSILFYWDYQEVKSVIRQLDTMRPNSDIPNIPSPILRDYTWPGIYKPFNHQRDTASFLSVRQRAFCFNEAGTGKTSAAIWAADYLMTLGLIKRVLIICPLSIMYSAWQADIFKTTMHRTCGVAYGDAKRRTKIIEDRYDFIVTNFEGVGVAYQAIDKDKFDLIIVDEANAYKTASTKRW